MKKIIAFLTVISMVLSLVPICVSADGEAQNQSTNMKFLKSIGIVQNDAVDGTEALSRIELAKMYYSIMTGFDLPEYSPYESPYSDVTEKELGYIKVVSDAKIMTGVEADRFGVAENVTYIQLIKTVVTFLGYDAHAKLSGGWPYGYLSVANSLGLTQNAPSDMNVGVTFNAAADVLRLAAEADLLLRSDFTEETYKPYSGNGYLEYYMGITLTDGIVTSSSTIDITGDDAVEFGKVKIGQKTIPVSEKALDIYAFVGQSVTAFVSGKSGKDEVVYYEVLENNVYKIAGDDIISVEDEKICYDKSGKDAYIKYGVYTSVIYNGTLAKSYTDATLNPFTVNKLDGNIVGIDNNGDKICDIIMVEAYETFLCGGVRDMVATSDIIKGKQADFSEFGENSLAILNAIGEPISHTDIVAGDVLNCFYDITGKLTKIVVLIDSGKGIIDEIKNGAYGIESLVISGKEYECANSLSNCPDYLKLNPGDSVTYWFNKDYKIGIIKKGISESELALTVDFKQDKSLDGGYQIKLLDSTGKFIVYTLADKVDISGNKVSDDKFLDSMGVNSESGKIERQLIKYAVNEEGKLSNVILPDSSKDESGNYTSDFFIYDDFDGTQAKYYRSELYSFGLTHYVNSNSKIFVVPTEANRDNERAYAVKNSGYFSNGNYTLKAYSNNKYSPLIVAAIHVSTLGASGNLDSTSRLLAISKITNTFNEYGDEIIRVDGFYSESSSTGELRSYTVDSEDVLNVGANGETVEAGDVVMLSVDATGNIDKMKLVFDKSMSSLYDMSNPSGSYPGADQRFAFGDVVCTDGNYITIELKDSNGTVKRESYPVSRFGNNGALCETDERTGKITYTVKPKPNMIFDRETYGEDCSKAIVFIKGSYWITGIIYND